MKRTLGSSLSQKLCESLTRIRKEAGLTQRDLAAKLNRERSFVARIELGERRVDIVEFLTICEKLEIDPVNTFQSICNDLKEAKQEA